MSFNYKSLFIAGISALVLSACGNISKVSPEGATDEPVWPKVDVENMQIKGIYPDLSKLKEIKSGMTKDQLYYLLGHPHFGEGFVAVREWDYLLHFHTPGQGINDVTTCQFKVLYDTDKLTRDFHWNAVNPSDASVCPPGAEPQRFSLDADALFAFDSSTLRAVGQSKLQEFANSLNQIDEFSSIEVSGYTDRLGADSYNLKLSQDRANSVRNYLVNLGVPSNQVSAQGYGKSNPVVQCDGSGNELVACLQPNRRVEIELKR